MENETTEVLSHDEPITDEQFAEMIRDENHDISISEVSFTGSLLGQMRRYYNGDDLSNG